MSLPPSQNSSILYHPRENATNGRIPRVDLGNIPHDIRERNRFVLWTYRVVTGRLTKVPVDPRNGAPIDATDPGNWRTFADAAHALRPGLGLGVALNGDGLIGIDLDHCVDAYGVIAPEAQAVIDRSGSYAELSPSGTGIHNFVRGELPPEGHRRGGYEIYDSGRFMTLTGNRVPGTPATIAENQPFIDWFHAEHIARSHSVPPVPLPTTSLTMSDEEVLAKAYGARNGPALQRLLTGDLGEHGNDRSAADLAAASMLAFWTQDPDQIARIMSASPLGARDKWQHRTDYRAGTIAKSLQRSAFYSPRGAEPALPARSHSVPPGDPCTTERDTIAHLRAENAALRAQLDQTRAERDQGRHDLSMVIKTLGNPNLGGDAAGKALILAATEVQHRSHTVPPGDGYVQVNASRVADNREWVTNDRGDRVAIPAPAQVSPRTVTKYLALAASHGLIDAEKRDIPAPPGMPGLTPEGWFWKAEPTLADQLAPLAGGSVYTIDNPRPLRGGDPKKRRSLRELPTCPDCGGRHVACAECGSRFELPAAVDLDSGELLTEADLAEGQPQHRSHSVPPGEDVADPTVDVTLVDKFVGGVPSDRSHTVPPGMTARLARAAADLAARYSSPAEPPPADAEPSLSATPWLPGLDPPLPDRYTDVAFGGRP